MSYSIKRNLVGIFVINFQLLLYVCEVDALNYFYPILACILSHLKFVGETLLPFVDIKMQND